MFLLLDNYDSFTYNLYHYMLECGVEVQVHRNDALSVEEVLALKPEGIVISPGPGDPDDAGISLALLDRLQHSPIPVLGVCLGHQCIGQAFGGTIARATPMHGKVSSVTHTGQGVFADLPSPYNATRYHSLVVTHDSIPECLMITAETQDGLVMGLQHKSLPFHGVQFHPESIASEHGHTMLHNFIALSHQYRQH